MNQVPNNGFQISKISKIFNQVPNNGFNPTWNEETSFTIRVPELAIVEFKVSGQKRQKDKKTKKSKRQKDKKKRQKAKKTKGRKYKKTKRQKDKRTKGQKYKKTKRQKDKKTRKMNLITHKTFDCKISNHTKKMNIS